MSEAIILVGGLGTRLREAVPNLPKPMAPVDGKPFLEYLLNKLALAKFKRVILSTGHQAGAIESYFGSKFLNIDLVYSREQSPLGTGGAIRLAMEQVYEDHVYVMNGDTFSGVDLLKLEEFWTIVKSPILVGKHVSDIARYGGIQVSENSLIGFSEKGNLGSGIINVGTYVLPSGHLKHFSINQNFSFENDFLAIPENYSQFKVFLDQGLFIDIGIPSDYYRAQKVMRGLCFK